MIWSRSAVPLLALAIAFSQVSRAGFGTLSPWKGGGFGMFASIDQPGNRTITIRVQDHRGEWRGVRLMPDATYGGALSTRARLRARTAPSARQVQDLANHVAGAPLRTAEPWTAHASPRLRSSAYYHALTAVLPAKPHVDLLEEPQRPDADFTPRAARVEILHFVFDAGTFIVRLDPLQAPASARVKHP